MVKNMKRNLKNMMSRILFFLLLIISSNVYSTSSMNGVYVDNGNISIHCDESDGLDYSCSIHIYKKYNNTIRIKNNNDCGYFSISPKGDDEVVVECGFKDISNIYTYKLIDDNLLLDKYEYHYVGGPSDFDNFIIDNLVSFRRNISTDISDNGNRMFSLGYVNKKSYLYNENYNKTDMYLVKGDKVLILDVKKDSKNNKWYKILFPGKKNIIKWIRSYNISYI